MPKPDVEISTPRPITQKLIEEFGNHYFRKFNRKYSPTVVCRSCGKKLINEYGEALALSLCDIFWLFLGKPGELKTAPATVSCMLYNRNWLLQKLVEITSEKEDSF